METSHVGGVATHRALPSCEISLFAASVTTHRCYHRSSQGWTPGPEFPPQRGFRHRGRSLPPSRVHPVSRVGSDGWSGFHTGRPAERVPSRCRSRRVEGFRLRRACPLPLPTVRPGPPPVLPGYSVRLQYVCSPNFQSARLWVDPSPDADTLDVTPFRRGCQPLFFAIRLHGRLASDCVSCRIFTGPTSYAARL